jgi:hypothetical protein
MAQTEHLLIYKAAYDCCLYFEQLVRNFPRYHKFSIGQDRATGPGECRAGLLCSVPGRPERERSSREEQFVIDNSNQIPDTSRSMKTQPVLEFGSALIETESRFQNENAGLTAYFSDWVKAGQDLR